MRRIACATAGAVIALGCTGFITGADAQPPRDVTILQAAPLSSEVRAKLFQTVSRQVVARGTRTLRVRPALLEEVVIPPPTRRPSALNAAAGAADTVRWMMKCEAGDPSVPPHISKLKGKIGSGGYLVIDGECFGDAGVVELAGDFPGGRLVLQNQSWSHATILVGIPSVRGVYEHVVRIRVVRGNVQSNEVAHAFVPEMETRDAPRSMIVSLSCPFDPGGCRDGSAQHYSHGQTGGYMDNGNNFNLRSGDRWEVKPPRGWLVDSLDWTTSAGVTTIGNDWDTSSATDAVFTMNWENSLVKVDWHVIGDEERYYAAVYAMTVHLVGPKGTWR